MDAGGRPRIDMDNFTGKVPKKKDLRRGPSGISGGLFPLDAAAINDGQLAAFLVLLVAESNDSRCRVKHLRLHFLSSPKRLWPVPQMIEIVDPPGHHFATLLEVQRAVLGAAE
jgi:hypothetical protein